MNIKLIPRSATEEEAELFYSSMDESEDRELACVGHLRMDFGHKGREFWSTWWPHNDDVLNVPVFKDELDRVVNELRECGPLKDLSTMAAYCTAYPDGRLGEGVFGFIIETERYRYCLRCTPRQGDYNGYLYAYDKHQQALNSTRSSSGLTDAGRQALQAAADPSIPHEYEWFVIEGINTPQERLTAGSLEYAIQQYIGSGSRDKRLGVTKDCIATVDLVVQTDGVQRFFSDHTALDSFKQDPMVAAAVQTLHRVLDDQAAAPTMGMKMEGV